MGMGLQLQVRWRPGVYCHCNQQGGVEGWHCQSLVVIYIKLMWLHSLDYGSCTVSGVGYGRYEEMEKHQAKPSPGQAKGLG